MYALSKPGCDAARMGAAGSCGLGRRAVPPLAARRQRAVQPRAQQGEPGVSEDVIARLRAAEEEAARLKQELAAAQAAVSVAPAHAFDAAAHAAAVLLCNLLLILCA